MAGSTFFFVRCALRAFVPELAKYMNPHTHNDDHHRHGRRWLCWSVSLEFLHKSHNEWKNTEIYTISNGNWNHELCIFCGMAWQSMAWHRMACCSLLQHFMLWQDAALLIAVCAKFLLIRLLTPWNALRISLLACKRRHKDRVSPPLLNCPTIGHICVCVSKISDWILLIVCEIACLARVLKFHATPC